MKMRLKLVGVVPLILATMVAHAETTLEFGLTNVTQNLSKDKENVEKENLNSFDMTLDTDLGSGVLHVYVEGSSTTQGSVPTLIEGANYDAGTSLDADGQGRVQLSGISYRESFTEYSIAIGMHDLFEFVDGNSTSNSETSQFLADTLVNNPTIETPDYTVSTILNYDQDEIVQASFMLANANGLSDNASADYYDLIDFGNNDDGSEKGLFGLAEFRMYDQGMWLSLGRWTTTRELNPISGSYVNLDSAEDKSFAWSLRLGKNDDDKTFGAFSTSFGHGDSALGVGFSVQKFGGQATSKETITLLETYYRWQISDAWSLTPDVQFWKNANGLASTNPTTGVMGGKITVYALRLQYEDALSF